jgi:hypothetical protein
MSLFEIMYVIAEVCQSLALILIIIDISLRFKKIENSLEDIGIDIEAYDKLKKQIAQQNSTAKKIKKVGKWK